MTRYEVVYTSRAKRELNAAADWIAQNAPETAERWFHGFVKAIESLAIFPQRCGLARENDHFDYEVRQLLYGRRRTYRAVFTIREKTVLIIAIRHAAQDELRP